MADDVIGSAIVELSVKLDGLQAGLDNANEQLHSSVEGMHHDVEGLSFAVLAEEAEKFAEKINEVFDEALSAFSHLEDAHTKLGAIMKATNDASGMTSDAMAELADKIAETTTQTKASAVEAEALLSRFTEIDDPEIFEATIQASADLAAVTGGDLTGAVQMLGVALSDPEQAFGRLKRSGITFSEEQQNTIKALQDGGDMAGAEAEMLKALEGRVGGLADAMTASTEGAHKQYKKGLEEIMETVGSVIANAIKPFYTEFAKMTGGIVAFLERHPAFVAGLVAAAAAISALSAAAALAAAAMVAWAIAGGPVVLALAGIAAAVGLAVGAITALTGKTETHTQTLSAQAQAWMDAQKTVEAYKKQVDLTAEGTRGHELALQALASAQKEAREKLEAYRASVRAATADEEENTTASKKGSEDKLAAVKTFVDGATNYEGDFASFMVGTQETVTDAVANKMDVLAQKSRDLHDLKIGAAQDVADTEIALQEAVTDAATDSYDAMEQKAGEVHDQQITNARDMADTDITLQETVTDAITASYDAIARKDRETTDAKKACAKNYADYSASQLLEILSDHETAGKQIVDARNALNDKIKSGDASTMEAFEAGLKDGLTHATTWTEDVYNAMKAMGASITGTLQNALVDAFDGKVNGYQKYIDAMRSAFTKAIAGLLADWIFEWGTEAAKAALAGGTSGTAYMAAYNAALASGASQSQAILAGQQAGGAGAATVGGGSLAGMAAPALAVGALALLSFANKDSVNKALGGGVVASAAEAFVDPIGALQDIGNAIGLGGSQDHHAFETTRDTIIALGIKQNYAPDTIQSQIDAAAQQSGKPDDPKWKNVPALDAYRKTWNDSLAIQRKAAADALTYNNDAKKLAEMQTAMINSSDPSQYAKPMAQLQGIMNQIKTSQTQASAVLGTADIFSTLQTGYAQQATAPQPAIPQPAFVAKSTLPADAPATSLPIQQSVQTTDSSAPAQPAIIQLVLNGRELATALLDMSRTGQLKLDSNALITVGHI